MGSSAQPEESLGATGKRVAFSPWGGKRSVRAALGGQGDALALDAPEMLLDGDEDTEGDIFPSSATVYDAAGRFKRMAEDDGGATPAEAMGEAIHDKNATRNARDTQSLNNAATKWNAPTPALLERRAFSAWAGKRADGEDVKRQAFSPWAGKRSSDDEKRQAFSAWAGKRSSDDEKRQAFSPWAGKRAFEDEKRQAFSAWAGKRASDDEKRQAFSAWAGKRAFDEEKRQAFSPWAGKRADEESKRQAFSPWAGKRDFSAWAGKRSSVEADEKQPFSAWAEKQSDEGQDHEFPFLKMPPQAWTREEAVSHSL